MKTHEKDLTAEMSAGQAKVMCRRPLYVTYPFTYPLGMTKEERKAIRDEFKPRIKAVLNALKMKGYKVRNFRRKFMEHPVGVLMTTRNPGQPILAEQKTSRERQADIQASIGNFLKEGHRILRKAYDAAGVNVCEIIHEDNEDACFYGSTICHFSDPYHGDIGTWKALIRCVQNYGLLTRDELKKALEESPKEVAHA